MRFCTSVNCMDGRVQLPVITYLQRRFAADYVDVISEPGPNRILGRSSDRLLCASIVQRIQISVEKHGSVGIAVAGHHDCAGNPAGIQDQTADTLAAVVYLRRHFPALPIIALWVNEQWEVSEIAESTVQLQPA